MSILIQHKRGPLSNLPALEAAEIALTTDTTQLFIGTDNGNIEIAKLSTVTSQISALSAEVASNLQAAKDYTDAAVTALGGSTNIGVATSSDNGLMSSTDKAALDALVSKQAEFEGKETVTGSQAKADAAESNAKNYADGLITDLIGTAPETLNTIEELATAISDLGNVDQGITAVIAEKADKDHDHEAADIVESTDKRFVSDAEKTSWNAKADTAQITSAVDTAKAALDTSIAGVQTEVNNLKTSKADASEVVALAARVSSIETVIDGGTF